MDLNKIDIKNSSESDLEKVLFVEQEAFGGNDEAELTNKLLHDKSAVPIVSLLAFFEDETIGHILFTKARLEGNHVDPPSIYILAPLAVISKYQKKGVGGVLIKRGLEILREMKVDLVFVLGHIDYYPRHGFINDARQFGYPAPYPIPEEVKDAWMVQELTSNSINRYSGKVLCSDALDEPEYWRE